MKLFILNGESNYEKIEISINEHMMVEDIKRILGEVLYGFMNYTNIYLALIYKNVVLCGENSIKFYKICENDEIWFGKIENYLRKDDVIVDVFVVSTVSSSNYFIVKKNDKISTIRSIMKIFPFKITNIWNADGREMKSKQFVTEIDTNENYKLIIRCDVWKGNEDSDEFDEICYLHDIDLMNKYLFCNPIRHDDKDGSQRMKLINFIYHIRQIYSLFAITDELKQDLSDFPSSYLCSTKLFSIHMAHYIKNVIDFTEPLEKIYENDLVTMFKRYIEIAIISALCDYSILNQYNKTKTIKSIKNILFDALGYFMKYLTDFNNDWRYWLRLWMEQFSLFSTDLSCYYLDEMINEFEMNKFAVKIKINGKISDLFVSFKPKTILKAKRAISKLRFINMKFLRCIKPGGDHKLNDKDKFENEFIIEILMK